MPFFTIVIPAYNRADFLHTTIQSVLQQQFKDFEIIIVDDGSTDNTKEVVESIIKGAPQVRYIYQKNAERGAARNNGIKNAKGDFVLFIDSDDIMKPTYLKNLNEGINKNNGYNFYAIKYNFVNNNKVIPSSISSFTEKPYGLETVLEGNPFACNFCIKRANKGLKLFVEDRTLATTEDWMFLVENLHQDKIFVIDEIGLSMIQHDGRSMQQNKMLIGRRIKATELLCDRLTFTNKQKDTLWAYSYYFCSIHAYLDCDSDQALELIKKAVGLAGWDKVFFKAYLKYKVGRKAILKFKSLINNN